MPRILARLPIRVRLTLISAVATTVLFGVLAWFLYTQFEGSVNASINSALRARAGELTMLGHHPRQIDLNGPASEDVGRAAYFQVLTPTGAVLAASAGYRSRPLLGAAARQQAQAHPEFLSRHERWRLYAVRAPDGDIVVAGVSLAQQQKAFITFNWELLAGTPLMILIAAIITYLVGGKLLAPVDAMRRQASRISTGQLDSRLPLPESVDEIHRLASTLNEMLDRLAAGIEHELRFVSDASHELRTPLAVLKGELELALEIDGSRGDYRAATESAAEEADRLIALSENLLVLARTQQAGLALTPRLIGADELSRRVVDRARRLDGAELAIGDSSSSADCMVMADPAWLDQALLNLIQNALRHGGGPVSVDLIKNRDEIEIHVRDPGPGFPEAFLPHAFERFSRADAARGRDGAGLGMSIVAAIASAHGGRAAAQNRPEGGADVWISLPVAHPLGSTSPAAPAAPAATTA